MCAVWNAPEPVSVQDRWPDAGSGGVPDHRRGGVAAGRCIVLLQETEGAASTAPPQPRRVPSSLGRHPVLSSELARAIGSHPATTQK